MNPQLDLFSTRLYQNELFGAEYTTIRPENNLDSGPIDFIIKDTRQYYDLSQTMFSLKLKIVNADDTPVAAASTKDEVPSLTMSCTLYSVMCKSCSVGDLWMVWRMVCIPIRHISTISSITQRMCRPSSCSHMALCGMIMIRWMQLPTQHLLLARDGMLLARSANSLANLSMACFKLNVYFPLM